MNARRLALTIAASLCGLLGLLALDSAPAGAHAIHARILASAPFSQPATFAEPTGIAVDQETGNVYVADNADDVVDVFGPAGGSPAGGLPAQITGLEFREGEPAGIAVDNSCYLHTPRLTGAACESFDPSDGDVYIGEEVGTEGRISKFRPNAISGEYELVERWSPFQTQPMLAVDRAGDVYVAEGHLNVFIGEPYLNDIEGLMQEYDSSGAEIAGVDVPGVLEPQYVATGVPGVLYAGQRGFPMSAGAVAKLEVEPNGNVTHSEALGPSEEGKARAVAADAQGNAYVGNESLIRAFNASGEQNDEFGSGLIPGSQGIAVDDETGDVYVTSRGDGDVVVFGPTVVPDEAVKPVSEFPAATSATLKGTVTPIGQAVTGCEFEYGTEPGVFPDHLECEPQPPLSGAGPIAVSATATGLTQGATYHYRLSATDANGTGNSAERTFFQPETVKVDSESTSFVESTAATLEAQIDAGGSEALTYHFEYGLGAGEYDHSVPVPSREVQAGSSDVSVTASAGGLTPATTYHYRVVASNALPGQVAGPDQTFTTFTPQESGSPPNCPNQQLRAEQPYGLGLPDCRAYEMVSPLAKNGANVSLGNGRAAASGDGIVFESPGSFGEDARGSLLWNDYLSQRGPDGWSTSNITPPHLAGQTDAEAPYLSKIFSPELTKGILETEFDALTSDTTEGFFNLYVANLPAGSYEGVSTRVEPGTQPFSQLGNNVPRAVGASSDLSRVVFEEGGGAGATEGLLPGSTTRNNIYAWHAGRLTLVSLNPEGDNFAGAAAVGAAGASKTEGAYRDQTDKTNAVSSDGERVFFSASEETGDGYLGQLYLRENAGMPQSPYESGHCTVPADACTIEVSASQKTNGTGPGGTDPHGAGRYARYWDAAADGSRVFFTSWAELTDDANTGHADNAANLYEYDVETGALTDLSVDTHAGDVNGAEVLGVVSASEDGSYVYFVATGVLASKATRGEPNLYAYHAGAVKFIATLAPGDQRDWTGNEEPQSGGNANEAGPAFHTAQVSGDGASLAFVSEKSLTGYDNEQAEPGQCEEQEEFISESGRCREVFVYGAEAGKLSCASCNPRGTRPTGPSRLDQFNGAGANLPSVFYLPRNFSSDGSRLFFESGDALLPQTSNGLWNVYEYEGGHDYPISDPAGASETVFLDASASGDDVFIATADRLVSSDTDRLIDVYDARVGGGYPVPVSPPSCLGDTCQNAPEPPVDPTPASAGFEGAGNAKQPNPPRPSCAKGRVRRHGRCVKHVRKHHRATKHSNKRGRK